MSFLLHRDACVAVLRGKRRVVARAARHSGNLHVSVLTIMDLELWLVLPQTPSRHLLGYRDFQRDFRILDVNEAIAHRAAGLGSRLRLQGQRVNNTNLLIAATALVHGLTLVTHATRVYANIPGLLLEDWSQP
jgi:tRNA(fMet)-specific endonuclease VapC